MALRVAIIGAGQVGGTVAYTLLRQPLYTEIVLVDIKLDLLEGQVRDLSDAVCCDSSGTSIRAAKHRDAGQCDIVIITAGSRKRFGETSIQTTDRTASMLRGIFDRMHPIRSDMVIVIVSNPVDICTTITAQISGLPKSQVIGSGTFLDTIRLRRSLADKLEVGAVTKKKDAFTDIAAQQFWPALLDTYVLGQHGDSQFVAWSIQTVGGYNIREALDLDPQKEAELEDANRHETEQMIRNKGGITFGIASVVAQICSAIALDRRDILSVSHFQDKYGCCLSLPAVIGRRGVLKTVAVGISEEESTKLDHAAEGIVDSLHRVLDDNGNL